jgi:hypothetical protein
MSLDMVHVERGRNRPVTLHRNHHETIRQAIRGAMSYDSGRGYFKFRVEMSE